jgi:hypothetical protein
MTPCKEWTGRKDKDGYGVKSCRDHDERLHRLAWVEVHGQIPRGMCVLHRCDNRACHNVEHLFLGTRADNMRDMTAKGRRKARSPTGELAARAKLTLAQVEAIRSDPRPPVVVAREYGISGTNVRGIKKGLIWRRGNGYYGAGVFAPAAR